MGLQCRTFQSRSQFQSMVMPTTPPCQGYRHVRSGVSGLRNIYLTVDASILLKRMFFILRRDTEKLLQGRGPVTLSGPICQPSHSGFLTISITCQLLPTPGPLPMKFPTRLALSHSLVTSPERPSLTITLVSNMLLLFPLCFFLGHLSLLIVFYFV